MWYQNIFAVVDLLLSQKCSYMGELLSKWAHSRVGLFKKCACTVFATELRTGLAVHYPQVVPISQVSSLKTGSTVYLRLCFCFCFRLYVICDCVAVGCLRCGNDVTRTVQWVAITVRETVLSITFLYMLQPGVFSRALGFNRRHC